MVAGGLRRVLGRTGRRVEGQVYGDRRRAIGLRMQSQPAPILMAAVCVTRHTSPHARNRLPLMLSKARPLPATEAVHGEPLQPGHIYMAPPPPSDHDRTVQPMREQTLASLKNRCEHRGGKIATAETL